MALIGSLALSIRAQSERLRQDLKPALDEIKRVGQAMMDAGMSAQEANREMARMRADAVRGPKAVAEATDGMRQKLQAAKQGAAALSGAISAMSSEVGGAVGHVTRLGTSLTSAFLAGGPVALGVTALAAGISAIAGSSSEAAKAAEEARKAHLRWMDDAKKATDTALERVEVLRDRMRAISLGAPELAGAFTDERKGAEVYKEKLDEVMAAELRLSNLQRDRAKAVAGLIKNPKTASGVLMNAPVEARIKALDAEIAREREKFEQGNKILRALEDEVRLRDQVAQHEAESVKTTESRVEVTKEEVRAVKEVVQEKENLNKRIGDAYGEIADMVAMEQKLKESSEAQAKAAETQADAAQAIASATEMRVEAEKAITEQVREQQRLVTRRPDITKRFSNVGGSMFGFGAGQAGTGIGDIGGDAARAARGAGPWSKGGGIGPLAASIAGGKGLDLPDPSAAIKAMDAEIAKIPPLFERLTGAVTGASATTRRVVGDLGRSTEKAVGALRSDQNAMEAEVRALARAIERAGAGNGAGD